MRLLVIRKATSMSDPPETCSVGVEERFPPVKQGGIAQRGRGCICNSRAEGQKGSICFPGETMEVSPNLLEEIEGEPSAMFQYLI